MEHDIIRQKYPKSRKGRQCIGPCYPPKKWVIHPITLEYYTHKALPFCPTETWIDPDTKKPYNIDECVKPSKHIDNATIEMNIIMPKIHFTSKRFLKIYYKIYSFDSALVWINENRNKSIYTKLRILNSAWKAYGTQDVINEQLINVYMYIIKKFWIKKIYTYLNSYIQVNNKKIYFKKVSPSNKNKIEKINFIMKKLVTKNSIYRVLSMYVNNNIPVWEKIDDHNKKILMSMIEYFTNKIKESLK